MSSKLKKSFSKRSFAHGCVRPVLGTLLAMSMVVLRATTPSGETVDRLIESFFKPEEIHSVTLSPDGGTIAFQKHSSRGNSLQTVDTKTLKQLGYVGGDAGEQIFSVRWVDDAHVSYMIVRFDKYLSEVVVANRTLSNRKALLPEGWPDILDTTPYVKEDVLIQVKRTDGLHSDVIRVDIGLGRSSQVLEASNPGDFVGWAADLAGHVRIGYKKAPAGRTTLAHRADGKKAWEDLVAPIDTEVVGFDAAGNLMLVSYPLDGGRAVLQGYDLVRKELAGNPIGDPVYDVLPTLMRNNATREIAALRYDAAKPQVLWLDNQYAELHREVRKLMPGEQHWFHGVTSGNEMLIESGSDVQPTNYWLLNLSTSTARFFKRSRPWIKADEMCPMEPINFLSRDGKTIYGYLTKPRGKAGPHPLVMVVHGGPYARDTWGFDREVQFLAALGYAVLQVNFRGSTGYGRDYWLPTYLDVVKTSVDDVADGARWAIHTGVADEKRVAVYGASFGGYAALASAVRYPGLYRCVMGYAGVYDFEEQVRALRREHGAMLDWHGERFAVIRNTPEKFRPYSPQFQAEAVQCPVWLRHGGADPVVAAAQTKSMAAALKKAGKEVDVSTDTWGVHGLYEPEKRQKFYRSFAAFLAKNLPVE